MKPFANPYQGFTPFSNAILDEIMPRLSANGWKILCIAIRQTLGWLDPMSPTGRKQSDQISYSQFMQKSNIKSRSTISRALEENLDAGYLLRQECGRDPRSDLPLYAYSLDTDYELSSPESGPLSSPESGPLSSPESGLTKQTAKKPKKPGAGDGAPAADRGTDIPTITRPGFKAEERNPGVRIYEIDLDEYDLEPDIQCPCGESWLWPRTEKERRKALVCPSCGTNIVVHGFKSWGQRDRHTYKPRNLPRREWVITLDGARTPYNRMTTTDDDEVEELVRNWDLDPEHVLEVTNGWLREQTWLVRKPDEVVHTLNAALKSRRRKQTEWDAAASHTPKVEEAESDRQYVEVDGMEFELVDEH